MAVSAELQRVVVVFIAWLQVWQGSRIVLHTSQRLLPSMDVVQIFQAPVRKVTSAFNNRLVIMFTVVPRITAIFGKLNRHIGWLQQMIVLVAFLTASVIFSIWAFHNVWRITTSFLTVVLWWFAAMDTSSALLIVDENVYTRKLSFWVLARCWLGVTTAPYIGALLGLLTPFIFTFFLLAGDKILNTLMLPAMKLVKIYITTYTKRLSQQHFKQK